MSYETILVERDGPVTVVRLNRPGRMNAVIEQMYLDLQDALRETAADPGVRALVLTGSVRRRPGGDKQAFCAGADLKEHASGSRTPAQQRAYIELAHETTRMLYELPRPTIAAINGPARGAGAELALNCDVVLMADAATVAFPETGLATFVGGGVTAHLTALVGMATAKRLVYTGEVLDGPAAVAAGLAQASYPVEALMPAAMALAGTFASKGPRSMALAKALIQAAPGRTLGEVLDAETGAILACMTTEDWREGVEAFAEKRQPRYRGR